MSRHAVVDLTQTFGCELYDPQPERLPGADVARLEPLLELARLTTLDDTGVWQRLSQFRAMYEPYVGGLAIFFVIELPPWMPDRRHVDDW